MNARGSIRLSLVAAITIYCSGAALLADPFPIVLKSSGPQVELSWPAALTNAGQQPVLPEFEVQYSSDLKDWKPIGGKVRGVEGLSGPMLSLSLNQQQGPVFYRIRGN